MATHSDIDTIKCDSPDANGAKETLGQGHEYYTHVALSRLVFEHDRAYFLRFADEDISALNEQFERDLDSEINDKVEAFLNVYNSENYRKLARQTRDLCEVILEELDVGAALHWRTWNPNHSKDRLTMLRNDKDFRRWIGRGEKVADYSGLADLASVRIGVLLPSDIAKVCHVMEQKFEATVINITTSKTMPPNPHSSGQKPGASRSLKRTVYAAPTLRTVVFRWQTLFQGAGEPPLSGQVEIKIGTAVSQAWEEVQMRLMRGEVKKNSATRYRLLGALKGLAYTNEVFLSQLDSKV
ncbi:hypothetical protein M011DRAFT_455140 [Sporormia fimetaria CBS 119925]|uniref:Uncharacterized protein n=1 Tax=Sporormia fimetaria CBS 119925 TaxID=1340428 RepID=A0A6A6VPF1_9PLEO|nr:hypothetical protein M011DRAFT_455140 [Sporormia fimetaria CBS 119925]